jgi:hypothetical protein
MSRHAGGEPAIVRELCRSWTQGGESAGLVYGAEFSRITLDPAPHWRSIVIGIAIRAPCYFLPLPPRIKKNAKAATLISGGVYSSFCAVNW